MPGHGGYMNQHAAGNTAADNTSDAPWVAHETAVVDPGATIGRGSRIWHFAHICAGARIGRNCSFGQNVFVANQVVIGNNVRIQNNVSVFDGVSLDDDVFCGPSMVFTNVINPRSAVPRKDEYKPTRVRKGASIGANATVLCGVTIGAYALIGAGTVVTADVPDFGLMVGVPARRVGWVCRCGETLPVGQSPHCATCKTDYVVIHDTCSLAESE